MSARAKPTDATGPGEPVGVAVIELFTSQGCSSCPPADRLLTRIDEIANGKGLPIYALSMHVDYWNRLGWTDPYSSREFTERQHAYANAAQSSRVYTPQMIVNGDAEFVGSNGGQAEQAIAAALNRPATATVQLAAARAVSGDVVRVDYSVLGAGDEQDLVVCVVADPGANAVVTGENAGRRLQHSGVVRAMRVEPLSGNRDGQLAVPLPAEIQGDAGLEVVAFVQHRVSRRIAGAAKTAINPRPTGEPTLP